MEYLKNVSRRLKNFVFEGSESQYRLLTLYQLNEQ